MEDTHAPGNHSSPSRLTHDTRFELLEYLEILKNFGIKSLPRPMTTDELADDLLPNSKHEQQQCASRNIVAESTSQVPPAVTNKMNTKKRRTKRECGELLSVIENEVATCTKCPHLAETRTQTVFGTGHPNPKLCFVGEAPGHDEDKQGEPFVGRAGQLLDKILEACNLKRSEVYILNTIKCRPPNNRNPNEEELGNCWEYATRQLEVLQPDFICCLGGVAAQTVLQTKTSIGKLRGEFHEFNGMQVMVTYHPAYLLRNPAAKQMVWTDMKMLMQQMGRPVDNNS